VFAYLFQRKYSVVLLRVMVIYWSKPFMFIYICKDLTPVFIDVSYAISHKNYVNGSLI